jgi:hypothetical protein
MGWSNTPGYYLLSQIDYNSYFQEILPKIMYNIVIDGIYVERDQNEIILFNTDKLNKEYTVNYILPFKFYDMTQKEEANIERAREFILDYDRKCNAFRTDIEIEENQTQLIDKYKEFSYISEDKSKQWQFDWFFTFCENYDPYTELVPNELNCKTLSETKDNEGNTLLTNQNCIKRYSTNLVEDNDFFECPSQKFTNKLSILNIEDVAKLKIWLSNINYFTEEKLKLFGSICRDRERILHRVL